MSLKKVKSDDSLKIPATTFNKFIDAARDFHSRIEVFPSNLIAGMFKFTKEEFFEIEDAGVRLPPQVKLQ